jgi:hypothetical protein
MISPVAVNQDDKLGKSSVITTVKLHHQSRKIKKFTFFDLLFVWTRVNNFPIHQDILEFLISAPQSFAGNSPGKPENRQIPNIPYRVVNLVKIFYIPDRFIHAFDDPEKTKVLLIDKAFLHQLAVKKPLPLRPI